MRELNFCSNICAIKCMQKVEVESWHQNINSRNLRCGASFYRWKEVEEVEEEEDVDDDDENGAQSQVVLVVVVEDVRLLHIALAPLRSGTSLPRTWRLMTSLAPAMSYWPMKLAGMLGLHPNAFSSLSICCPLASSSSS
ncbi:hypothetical protein LguiB_027475 [Lonicera macranthoides]